MKVPDLNKYKKAYNIFILIFIGVFMVNVVLTFVFKDSFRAKSDPGEIADTMMGSDDNDDGTVSNDWQQVVFKDPNFERIVRFNLQIPETNNVVVKNVRKVKYLNLNHSGIKSLEGIECFRGLTKVDLSFNEISDLTPLTKLKKIEEIILYTNKVTDVSELAKIKSLKKLDLSSNQIVDPSSLATMKSLEELDLNNNKITEIKSLALMPNLKVLDISRNEIKDMDSLDHSKIKLVLDWGNKSKGLE